jgi:hypothetical protein
MLPPRGVQCLQQVYWILGPCCFKLVYLRLDGYHDFHTASFLFAALCILFFHFRGAHDNTLWRCDAASYAGAHRQFWVVTMIIEVPLLAELLQYNMSLLECWPFEQRASNLSPRFAEC